MKVKITTSVVGPTSVIKPGTVVDWPRAQAEAWVRAGKAVPVTKGEKAKTDRIKELGGGWYEVRGEKVQGKENALKRLE